MRAQAALDMPPSERLFLRDPDASKQSDTARPARRSAVERLAADRAKYVRSRPAAGRSSASESSGSVAITGGGDDSGSLACAPGPVLRRTIARKPLRPDSLVIYRQKCEFVRGPGADGSRASLVKKLFQGPSKDKALVPPETPGVGEVGKARGGEASRAKLGPSRAPESSAALEPCETPVPAPPTAATTGVPAAPPCPGPTVTRRGGLRRSQSDLSSRYSMALAEFDTFFQYCGLDPEVVETLGRENFSVGSDPAGLKVRSVSVATSDSGFSRHSIGGEDGLQEEELVEQVPSTTSVIERNARIIKWLYTCKKAKERPSQGLQGPA
ncbi:protein FAM110C [Nycticebus coucang]|uniref:protein FAM110C n=1 Tax=Nycticebus coucang TaxID=9470 RepID=UPI00234DA5CB|nr:protein FAM110C [Nycticebus coucang]XP_053445521.1 protein FAM110C [Nycticebus coucang]